MGLLEKNSNKYESEDVLSFFTIPEVEKKVDYEELKNKIYSLKIDGEEKANIINKINSLEIIKKKTEKDKIIKEIESFRQKNNI